MSAAIVTGATGFVGRWLVDYLLKKGHSVTAVIRAGGRDRLPRNGGLEIVECPMERYALLPELLGDRKGSIFYHLAWAGVSGGDRMDADVQMNNIRASAAAIEAAALGCSRFVGLGTIMEEEAAAVTEADGARPGMGYLYGEAKRFAHLQTKAIASQRGVEHIWAMLTNAYGEGENSPRFINTTLRKILRNEPLEFTAGTQTYDFIHVEDAARALAALGEKGRSHCSYMIGSGQAAPLRQFIETIGRTLAPERELRFGSVPYAGVQLPEERFSIRKLTEDTGFLPRISFEEGISRTMAWIREEAGQ